MIMYLFIYRMWWDWKGTNPNPATVAFMNKFYPADWTYAASPRNGTPCRAKLTYSIGRSQCYYEIGQGP
jgi:hypothetical protein